jgi:formate dehydrogenase major subunit
MPVTVEPVRHDALTEKAVIEIGPARSIPSLLPCAYCGVGCTFQAEMRGESGAHGAVQGRQDCRGPFLRQGRFAWGYTNHKGRITPTRWS